MIIDLLLGASLVWLGFRIITVGTRFKATIYFIVFGMMLSLVWTRLGAFDLALAEAALGSGITGALLLDCVSYLHACRIDYDKK
ncbi:MAG: Na(+)/H(+) antiporter subunit B [Campylobacterota bacterium]